MSLHSEGAVIYTYFMFGEKRLGESISVHLNYISQTTDTSVHSAANSLIKNSFHWPYVTGRLH